MLYVNEGSVQLAERNIATGQLARLSEQGDVQLSSRDGARVLLIAGKPLNEPIVQYGPFVMNSHQEIEQALRDYRNGTLA
jgi:redox-sensitive bicupin YhaK (pirin superfamily)